MYEDIMHEWKGIVGKHEIGWFACDKAWTQG
jgi:hypothetical protein